ncbi:MAG: hypothetical protein HQL64_04375 [Magnetococcales bacterium]|nr:hypothetical protein [Magnetococcales bacterium]
MPKKTPNKAEPGRFARGNASWSSGNTALRVLLLGLILFGGGCATLPGESGGERPSGGVAGRYQADQALRRGGFLASGWRVEGTLDMDTPKILRRNRMALWGGGVEWARLVLFGPFHDTAGELQLSQEWIRLSDPGKREVVEVPATVAGMHHLTGLALLPGELLELIQARAEVKATVTTENEKTTWANTTAGERLLLDPANGRLLERHGRTPDGTSFAVTYQWEDHPTEGVTMPEQVSVRLGEDAKFVVRLRAWSANDGAMNRTAGPGMIPDGFSVRHPLE